MVEINRAWVERLHAPRYIWSQIAALNPKRGILCREEKSQQQLLTWDVETGETHVLMPALDYQLNATLSQDGEFITYLVPHPTHADVYQYVRVPFGGGTPQSIAQTALMNASPHIEEAAGRIGFTAVTGNGYSVHVWTPDGKKPLFSYESEVLAYGPSLSFDGKVAVVATMQSPDSEASHLEAYDIDTGAKISQLVLPDTPLEAVKFAPFMGDMRLLVQAREGLLTRPLIWDVASGAVDRLKDEGKDALSENVSYIAWDWVGKEKIFLHHRSGEHIIVFIYDLINKQADSTFASAKWGKLLFAYTYQLAMMIQVEDIHGITLQTVSKKNASEVNVEDVLSTKLDTPIAFIGNSLSPSWSWISLQENAIDFMARKSRVIGVTFDTQDLSYPEVAAWVEQDVTYTNTHLDLLSHISFWVQAVEAIHHSKNSVANTLNQVPLLTAHNMAAALALLTLHKSDPSLWVGGVVVRPILDWGHLYESVAPPEKAMMRLWFGGSPTEQPQAWRDASPLRQTKLLTVPVKLLYHPYDSLTPIQHINTYAANNSLVELIDISRDMVGPAHEQQEKIITRMLEAGLPLLQKGT
jgi:DNA-directed RNA polymerase subunit L